MANSFGLLLAAIVIIFIIARCMKDAKAFTRLMAILALSFTVSACVKSVITKCNNDETRENTTVVSTISAPTCNDSTSVVEKVESANLDCMSKDIVERDSVEIHVGKELTALRERGYIDDS